MFYKDPSPSLGFWIEEVTVAIVAVEPLEVLEFLFYLCYGFFDIHHEGVFLKSEAVGEEVEGVGYCGADILFLVVSHVRSGVGVVIFTMKECRQDCGRKRKWDCSV